MSTCEVRKKTRHLKNHSSRRYFPTPPEESPDVFSHHGSPVKHDDVIYVRPKSNEIREDDYPPTATASVSSSTCDSAGGIQNESSVTTSTTTTANSTGNTASATGSSSTRDRSPTFTTFKPDRPLSKHEDDATTPGTPISQSRIETYEEGVKPTPCAPELEDLRDSDTDPEMTEQNRGPRPIGFVKPDPPYPVDVLHPHPMDSTTPPYPIDVLHPHPTDSTPYSQPEPAPVARAPYPTAQPLPVASSRPYPVEPSAGAQTPAPNAASAPYPSEPAPDYVQPPVPTASSPPYPTEASAGAQPSAPTASSPPYPTEASAGAQPSAATASSPPYPTEASTGAQPSAPTASSPPYPTEASTVPQLPASVRTSAHPPVPTISAPPYPTGFNSPYPAQAVSQPSIPVASNLPYPTDNHLSPYSARTSSIPLLPATSNQPIYPGERSRSFRAPQAYYASHNSSRQSLPSSPYPVGRSYSQSIYSSMDDEPPPYSAVVGVQPYPPSAPPTYSTESTQPAYPTKKQMPSFLEPQQEEAPPPVPPPPPRPEPCLDCVKEALFRKRFSVSFYALKPRKFKSKPLHADCDLCGRHVTTVTVNRDSDTDGFLKDVMFWRKPKIHHYCPNCYLHLGKYGDWCPIQAAFDRIALEMFESQSDTVDWKEMPAYKHYVEGDEIEYEYQG